jgi:hypothetical protein
MRATRSVAARKGKKADDRTMTIHPDADPTTVTDSADAHTVRPATTTLALDILMRK